MIDEWPIFIVSLQTSLLTLIAVLGLFLAMIGMYGILEYLVEQQTEEIGIRMALGAGSAGILRSVMGRCLRLTLVGIFLGGMGALILSRLLSGFLYGIKPTDPLTYMMTALILLLTAVLAHFMPARRASKVDPIVTLRCE